MSDRDPGFASGHCVPTPDWWSPDSSDQPDGSSIKNHYQASQVGPKIRPPCGAWFFLIIPLQGLASYNIIRAGNSEATQKIATITRGMAMIRDAQDETSLRAGINAIGIQNLPQGKLIIPIATVKVQILPQLSTEILKLKNESEKQRQRALRGLIFQWLRDGAVALLYGFGFKGLTMRSESEVIANPPLGADHQIPDRRLKLDDQKTI